MCRIEDEALRFSLSNYDEGTICRDNGVDLEAETISNVVEQVNNVMRLTTCTEIPTDVKF